MNVRKLKASYCRTSREKL